MKNIIYLVVFVAILFIGFTYHKNSEKNTQTYKVGIITDLTGPAAYWGEAGKIGALAAVQDLAKEGITLQPIIEDYQMDPVKAASAAQKLSNLDKVDAYYVDLNPGSIAASSVLKGSPKIFLYAAAAESPLKDGPNVFKTYLDFRTGCAMLAQNFKDLGVKKLGVLELNFEPGILCLEGIQSVYKDNLVIEKFNFGDTNLSNQMLKLKKQNVEAIINAGFPQDVTNTLKLMRTLSFKVPFGTVNDSITPDIKQSYPEELKGVWTFGFSEINKEVLTKLTAANGGKALSSPEGSSLTYSHLIQIVHALSSCKGDDLCAVTKLNESFSDNIIGFKKYNNRIADLNLILRQY